MSKHTKWCPSCEQDLPIAEFYINRARSDGLSPTCVTCHNRYVVKRNRRIRKAFIKELGGICETCGFEGDYRAFQIDHVAGNGRTERALIGTPQKTRARLYILAHRDEYQLLCANCNQIKKIKEKEYGKKNVSRTIPTQKFKGIGKGNAPSQRAALAWANQKKAEATHCQRGHEFTRENTILRPEGGRKCRKCHRTAIKRYQQKLRESP